MTPFLVEATIAATEHHQPAPDDGAQCVDATAIVNDLRCDLRRVRRCLFVQSVMIAAVLVLTLVAPIAVVLSQ